MKIRTGFVSNSSSSSFLIGFDKKPTSARDLANILYPLKNNNPHPPITCDLCDVMGYEPVPVKIASKRIFEQIKNQKPKTDSEIFDEISSGYVEGATDIDGFAQTSKHIPMKSIQNMKYEDLPEHLKFRYDYFKQTGVDIAKINTNECLKSKEISMARGKYERLWYSYLHEEKNKRIKQLIEKYKNGPFKDKKIFCVEFADDTGDPVEFVLEHGNTFSNVSHIKINKH